MYQILNPTGRFDRSPFQYARMTYLKSKVNENMTRYIEARRAAPGRVDSSHLLAKILMSLNSRFEGDLVRYIASVENEVKSLCSSLGIASSFSKTGIFTEGVFYPGCAEIIIYSRNDRWNTMDLWRDWRSVSPVEVINHPITDMTIFELGAKNEARINGTGLAVINIDIPLLAAQWKMWQASHPGLMIEQYLSTVPLVMMTRSHLNAVIFNKLLVKLGIRGKIGVKTNSTFMQTPTDSHADDIVDEIYDKVSKKELSGNTILDSIPVIYGDTYLKSVGLPSMSPTNQILWALITQKMEATALVLSFGELAGYDRMVHDLTMIKRTLIEINSDKLLTNGLGTNEGVYLTERLEALVVKRIPTAAA